MTEELYTEKTVTVEDAREHGITAEELEMIKEHLGGRLPTVTELGIYSGLWSEHASYKNSILLLKTLPSQSDRLLTKTGEENAGAIDIGDGLAVVFKIESHNHPTAIEPYQGAATGVGGIMRDIFTMGARPICSLNSLRFGPPDQGKNRYLLTRAVKGIGDYGNSLGIAVSGGELFFDPSFSRNCLVNAMTVGIVKHGLMAKAAARGEGNPIFYVGATTGRDGIHGASFASKDLTGESESKRSAVQVGDPFMEKLLLEATLELIASDAIVGIQDMGAAGLSCASSEMSAKGSVGMDLNLDLVPFRETHMSAYEIMLSESQERMLVCVKKGREQEVVDIFSKWGLHATQIGSVTGTGMLRVWREGKLCSNIPSKSLVLGEGAPRYKRESKRPAYLDSLSSFSFEKMPDTLDLNSDFLTLLSSINICSRRPLYEQYDTEVGLVKVVGPGADGGLARIPGTNKGIAVSTDCNSRYVYLDPKLGTMAAVCESARNVAVTGAIPLGITNNLNFGNPYNPESFYMMEQAVSGMREACLAFGIPVTGGNVSLYNESEDGPIYPTPTIGMVGLTEDISKAMRPHFSKVGSLIYLIGSYKPTLGGSEYLSTIQRTTAGIIPEMDLNKEKILCDLVIDLIHKEKILSAGDLSLGGLAVKLFKCAYNPFSKTIKGFELDASLVKSFINLYKRKDLFFFGESNASIIITVDPSLSEEVSDLIHKAGLDAFCLGRVTDKETLDFSTFSVDGKLAIEAYEGGLKNVFR